ncbi:unnamed protein product [Orchesella dallaii]|uniref:Uncharacterized protein n=1 Tax=Orchesella dallaii TaxID=48710 RepID=A0ABP1RZ06_9HEXA
MSFYPQKYLANGTSLPSLLPTLSLPTELLSLIPREEEAVHVALSTTTTTQAPVYVQYQQYQYQYRQPTPSPVITLKVKPQQPQPQPFTITPMQVPVSLDNKVRDRFIKQLALLDPLNCLPKLFCEVSADPYGTALSIPHGTITAVRPAEEVAITKEELVAYENHLIMEKTTTTTTTAKPAEGDINADTANDDEQNDSTSNESNQSISEEESDEEDDSFERYRKEQAYKLEMQAYDEMMDEIDDPETYLLLLRDKKRRKAQMKQYKKQQFMAGENRVRKESMLDKIAKANIDPPLVLKRRMGDDPPPPSPLDYMYPMMPTTESPMEDMFADDPFFNDFGGSSRRFSRSLKGKTSKNTRRSKTAQRTTINANVKEDDLMKKFRVAFIVAEKYHSPNACRVAFPTCPYQTRTILSVVNRLESGLLPFGKTSKPKVQKPNTLDNIAHFKNTLLAIESLNKATLRSQLRGEPLDVDKLAEDATSSTTQSEAITSQKIVNEFQQVVTKIGTSTVREKKHKKKANNFQDRRKYDVVHYYKMAMFGLKPKQRIKIKTDKINRKKFESVRQQDDEALVRKNKWESVPSFNQTYKDMFRVSTPKPRRRPRPKPTVVSKIFEKSMTKPTTTAKPVKQFEVVEEDDEVDAKESEEAVDALITQGNSNRSPIL